MRIFFAVAAFPILCFIRKSAAVGFLISPSFAMATRYFHCLSVIRLRRSMKFGISNRKMLDIVLFTSSNEMLFDDSANT